MPPTKGPRLTEVLTATPPPVVDLLTIEEAAGRISMSARYVRRLVSERRIGFYRIGRSVRIDPADLADFITAGRIEPVTETTVWNDLRSAA
jgi:excisionase family DNA binding protein